MKRILITGLSGVGKSSVVGALSERGYAAVDADCDEYSHWVAVDALAPAAGTPVESERDWVWREDRIRELLARHQAGTLFVSGCAPNMGMFLGEFDQVVLLTASPQLIMERLATRTTNQYGKRPEEVARVLDLIETVEPVLRRIATREIDTRAPFDAVVAELIELGEAVA
jgi:broad-specificity NMP kinase